MKTDYTTPVDKNKANQPVNNPFFDTILSKLKSNSFTIKEISILLQQCITWEKAKAHLTYTSFFKPGKHAELINISRETYYTWKEKYGKESDIK